MNGTEGKLNSVRLTQATATAAEACASPNIIIIIIVFMVLWMTQIMFQDCIYNALLN